MEAWSQCDVSAANFAKHRISCAVDTLFLRTVCAQLSPLRIGGEFFEQRALDLRADGERFVLAWTMLERQFQCLINGCLYLGRLLMFAVCFGSVSLNAGVRP